MNKILCVVILGMFLSESALAAGNAEAGKAKAALCGSCHGLDGHSSNDLWPNLAGQKEGYLKAQIIAFRDGTRVAPLMQPMVASLSDKDIEDLAAYYAGLK